MNYGKVVMTLFAGIFLLSAIPQVIAQDEVIKERKSLMKTNRKQLKAIKKAITAKDFGAVEASANLIVVNMDKMLDLFPKGSTSKKSRAKAEIWEKWDKFTQDKNKVKQTAEALAKAAAVKDQAEVSLQFTNVGESWKKGACGDCHKSFLKPRKRKKKR